MRENRVKAALKAGKTVVGAGMGATASVTVVRVMANAGLDFLFIDREHTLIDNKTLVDVVQAARLAGISPLVRPCDTEYDLIAGTLDSGADGLIVPRVETREQAERLVACSKFPPIGIRGCGTTATLDFKAEDWRQALPWLNEQILLAPQVESPKAIAALDDILKVPGIDVVVVGPLDLSINLGIPGQFTDPIFVAAVDRVVAICKAHGVASGIVLPPALCKPWWEKGMRFFSCGVDQGFIMSGASAVVQAVRAFGA